MQDYHKPLTNPPKKFQGGLKNKLIRVMILVGALPLLTSMIIAYAQGHKSLQEVIGASFKALAHETANKLKFILEEEIARNKRLVSHPTIVLSVHSRNQVYRKLSPEEIKLKYSTESRLWKSDAPEMNRIKQGPSSHILANYLKKDNPFVESTRAFFITDAKGILVSSINSYPKYSYSAEPFWKKTINGGKNFVFIGKVHMDSKLDEQVFHFVLPIIRHEKIIGLFHRIYSAKKLFSTFIETIVFGKTGHVMIINKDGIVISCPILPTGFQLSDPTLVSSVTGKEPNWVQTFGNAHESGNPKSIIGYSPISREYSSIKISKTHEWFTFAWQSSKELFAPTQKLFFWIMAAGIILLFLIFIIGSWASQKITAPIRTLQDAATRIGRGEKIDSVEIRTGDEIELLAGEINAMNRMIEKSFSGLETQVREKSEEVSFIKEYTENILMSVPDVLLIFDRNLKIEYVNASFEIIFHVSPEDIVEKTLDELDLKHSEAWKSIKKGLSQHVRGAGSGSESFEKYQPQDPLAQAIKPDSQESKTILEFGEHFFITQFFDVFIQMEDKHRIGLLMREVTEEKHLQDQLATAEKLSGLGTLAAGIAHEMNNPLYSIMGFTEAILDKDDPEKIKKYADRILERAKHMSAIILNLSGYSRANCDDKPRDIDFNERLDAALEIAILGSYSDSIRLNKNYSQLPGFKAKPEEIQQIFINIFFNAVQAMDGKGEIFISSKLDNGNININIRDTGPGIPQSQISKIFDPFFTTKGQGEGTGLGLSIVHKMVSKYGGQIDIQSPMGNGAIFNITFPQSA